MAQRQRNRWFLAALTIGMTLFPIGAYALDTADTRLLSTPAIAEGKIAFAYADDIWVADADGSNPEAVDVAPGRGAEPVLLAGWQAHRLHGQLRRQRRRLRHPHRGRRADAADLAPRRRTSSAASRPTARCSSARNARSSRAGTPSSSRSASTGGVPGRLPIPTADKGAISPDGKFLAYTPLGEMFRQWKNYRGGTASRIWVLKLDDLSHEEIPKPAGGCNDTEPMWIGETVYFLSDRDGEFNLYSYDRNSKTVTRCTHHDAFPIASASAGAGKIIYEQAGWIHRFDPHERESHRLKIGVAADLAETRPRYASGAKHIRERRDLAHRQAGRARVSRRDRHRAGQEGRPAQPHRDARRARTQSPVWSPDGKSIAYFSDASGEYQLVVRPQDGKGEGRSYPLNGSGLLRAAGLVARQQEDRLHRQLPHHLLDRPGHRRRQADRRRADLRTEPGLADATTPGRPTRSGWPILSPTAPAFRRSGFTNSRRTSPTP